MVFYFFIETLGILNFGDWLSVVGLLSRSLTSTLRSGEKSLLTFRRSISVHVSFGQQTPRVSAHHSDIAITFRVFF